jgi:hypothetical protein
VGAWGGADAMSANIGNVMIGADTPPSSADGVCGLIVIKVFTLLAVHRSIANISKS